MSGFLSLYNKAERVNLTGVPETEDGTWWVDVKVSITKSDYDAAQRRLMRNKLNLSGGKSSLDGDLDIPGFEEEMLVRSIVGWNLTDDSGTTLPLSPEPLLRKAIMSLPSSVVSQIYERVNDLNGRRSEAETDSFRSEVNA
jgi:hypothetical protein